MDGDEDASSKLTLCLQSKDGRHIISLLSAASTKALYDSASKEFPDYSIESLKGGFPPITIPSSDDSKVSDFVSNQERIRVEFGKKHENVVKNKKNSDSNKKKNNNSELDVTKDDGDDVKAGNARRSKRAASKKATESMPAMIQAQQEFLKNTTTNGSKKKKSSFSSAPFQNKKKRERERKSTTRSSSNIPTKAKTQRVEISASAGVGRRLVDGATVGNGNQSGNRPVGVKRRRGIDVVGNTPTDISVALLGAVNNKSQMGKVLRKGMSNAVQTSYETSRSFSRLAAIQARSYQINKNGSGEFLNVTYRGSVDKSQVKETVDCVPRDILVNVLEGIYASNREALRPENLSRLSPRVIWSLVQYFPTLNSVPDMYHELLPNLDWKFLRRRAEQLSEKAAENKRQATAKLETGIDLERASNAVAAVEHAMESMEEWQKGERNSRQANAAEARLQRRQQNGVNSVQWTLTTPSEPDRDELQECINQASSTTSTSAAITKWINQLMKEHNIHNWRELSNVENIKFLSKKLRITENQIENWIDHAQTKSLPEIMVEICDNQIEAVEMLSVNAKCGTPKDLAAWRSIPDLLLEQLQREAANSNENSNFQKSNESKPLGEIWMDIPTISKWCDRAHQALQKYEWLNWYATPVD